MGDNQEPVKSESFHHGGTHQCVVVNALSLKVVYGLLAHYITWNEHESISIVVITNWKFEMFAAILMSFLSSEHGIFRPQQLEDWYEQYTSAVFDEMTILNTNPNLQNMKDIKVT